MNDAKQMLNLVICIMFVFWEGLKSVSGSVKIRREVRENMIKMHCKDMDLTELMKIFLSPRSQIA